MQRSAPRRRHVLAMLAGIPLLSSAACGLSKGSTSPRVVRPLSGDAALVAGVLRDEQRLLRRIDQAVASRPGTRSELGVARRIVATHITWLSELRDHHSSSTSPDTTAGGTSAGAPSTGTTSTATSSEQTASPATGPSYPNRTAAIQSVVGALSTAADARLRSCVEAKAGPLAQFLASMSASHAVLVEELRTA